MKKTITGTIKKCNYYCDTWLKYNGFIYLYIEKPYRTGIYEALNEARKVIKNYNLQNVMVQIYSNVNGKERYHNDMFEYANNTFLTVNGGCASCQEKI